MKKGILKAMLVGTMAVTLSVAGILTACGDDEGGGETYKSPVITVDPLTVSVELGTENVNLLEGVTVTDEYDKDLKATVSNNGGFTTETEGEYTVTYTATNSHQKTGTATRKYTVYEAGEFSAPVITVDPTEMEFEEGSDNVSLTFQVTVTDEYDADLFATVKSIISEDGTKTAADIDEMTEGVWVVTYTATNSKGVEGTATRTYTVTKAASNYVIEVQKENDANWVAKCGRDERKLVLDPKWYYEYSASASVNAAKSGIYRNMSNEEIVIDVIGGYGQAAIFTADGYMIEGRDGANGRLVNKDNPVRTASTLTTYPGTSTTVASATAKDMHIPAGGFAIVIFQGLLDKPGTDEAASLSEFDYGGRGWFNKNVVYQYGTAVKVYLQDDPETLLTAAYENHAPVVLTKPDVAEHVGSSAEWSAIEAKLLAGITYVDDNGTFEASDDIKTGLTITVSETSTPELNLNEEGEYVYDLSISDGTLSTTFTRTLKVLPSTPTVATIIIDGTWYELGDKVVVNPTSTSGLGSMDAIIYTSYFTGTRFVNNYGAYFIVGTDGKVRESYSPWDNTHVHMTGDPAVRDGTFNDVLSNASPLAAGEYIVLAVNGGPSFRAALQTPLSQANNYMLGKDVSLALIDYQPTLTANNSKYTPVNLAVNVNNATVTTYDMFIYTYGYTGSFANASYGQVLVVNANGEITYVFDGANGRVHLAGHEALGSGTDNIEGVRYNFAGYNTEYGTNISTSDYITHAFSLVETGGYILLGPNDAARSQAARNWVNGLRTRIGDVVTLGNLWLADATPAEPEASVKVGTNTFTPNNVGVNVDNADLSEYDVLIYTQGFEGTVPSYTDTEVNAIKRGIAAVIGADGNVKIVFDAHAAYVHFEGHTGLGTDNGEGNRLNFATYNTTNSLEGEAAVTRGNYAKLAVENLAEGEYVIFFVGETDAKTWADNNVRQQIGTAVELTAIDLNA